MLDESNARDPEAEYQQKQEEKADQIIEAVRQLRPEPSSYYILQESDVEQSTDSIS